MPIIKLIEPESDVRIGVWEITESAEELVGVLQLNDDERQFLDSLRNGKRYLHWLSSRVMLRKLLNTDQFIEIGADEKGKPFLKNFSHKISISHSHNMAAVMLSKRYEVGIDIEHIHPKVEKISKKFLSDKELVNIDPFYNIDHLMLCWCAKEAIFKWYAKGEVDFRQHLHLRNYDYRISGRMEGMILKDDCIAELVVHYEKMDQYMLAYVWR